MSVLSFFMLEFKIVISDQRYILSFSGHGGGDEVRSSSALTPFVIIASSFPIVHTVHLSYSDSLREN